MTVAFLEIEATSVQRRNWTYLKPQISDWKFLIGTIKRIGNLLLSLLRRREKGLKQTTRRCATNFMICRNYAKETVGLFTRIIGKISAFTAMQYLSHINNRPIGRVKYALA